MLPIDWSLLAVCVLGAVAGGLLVFHTVAAYYHVRYYLLRRDDAASWKIQKDRWLRPGQNRQAAIRSSLNLALGGVISGVLIAYFSTWIVLLAAFDPASHRSESLHQTVGPCYVEQTDITGLTRHEFLCLTDHDEDFGFDCLDALPAQGSRWYTVCGRPHSDRARWTAGTSAVATFGLLAFGALLLARSPVPAR